MAETRNESGQFSLLGACLTFSRCGSVLATNTNTVVLLSPSLPLPARPHFTDLFHGSRSWLLEITASGALAGEPHGVSSLAAGAAVGEHRALVPSQGRELLISERTGVIWPESGGVAKAAPLLFPLWQASRSCARFPRRWAREPGNQRRLSPQTQSTTSSES